MFCEISTMLHIVIIFRRHVKFQINAVVLIFIFFKDLHKLHVLWFPERKYDVILFSTLITGTIRVNIN